MERRNQYRSVPRNGELRASVRLGDGERTFEVMNLTSGGSALLVPPDGDPGFETGQRLEIAFTCAVLADPVRVDAVVVHVQDEVLFRVCGLAFVFSDGASDTLPADIRSLFNRRRRPRVPVDSEITLDVLSASGELLSTGRMLDLSECGLAFRTTTRLEVTPGDPVIVAFSLPTGTEPLRLCAIVRHLMPDGEGSECGAELDGVSTKDFEEQRLALVAFIVGRRRAYCAPQS